MAAKKQPRSRRVAWPEPGREGGGEFRLTWGRIAAIVGIFVGLASAVPTYWTITDHWMNRAEVEKAVQTAKDDVKSNKTEIDKALKNHADHDAGVQMWNQYGFAANRLEYLDDKAAECDAKRMTMKQLTPADTAICARYEAKQKAKTAEAADLKVKALESTKEK